VELGYQDQGIINYRVERQQAKIRISLKSTKKTLLSGGAYKIGESSEKCAEEK